jgi:hypothetical protein
MRNRYKIALGLLIALISLTLIMNLPIVNTGVDGYDCSFSPSNKSDLTDCTAQYNYESILQILDPLIYGCGFGCPNVRTITVAYAYLQSGTGSTLQNRGTANFSVRFNNPDTTTTISSSYNFTSSGGTSIALYSCTEVSTCESNTTLIIPSTDTTSYFNTTFYMSATIVPDVTYNYFFEFTDGQSVSGTLIAQ